ncbi:MAG: glycosyltransferase [Verrucomicrobia bacterium]|nr:glycosyltransferase [Verrucomicrobiota bacterium]
MNKPLVSIIMASCNHAEFIADAINSVIHQDYENWELIIADDASADGTLEILNSFSGDVRIRVFPFKNNRQYHMRNFSAQQARGKYLAFLNSDDLFYPEKLRRQIELLESNPELAAAFTQVRCIDRNSQRLDGHVLEKIFATENRTRQQWLRHFFISGNCLCISSAMIRRDVFEEAGGFNPLLIQIADLDLWIKTCFKKEIHIIPEMLTGMRVLANNLSAPGPASNSRIFIEVQQAYARYFSSDGIQQGPTIFPHLMKSLPEDTPAWRKHLLCRAAASLQPRAMRLLGFTEQHALLANEEIRQQLQKNNPRLLRTLFLSEGAAGLEQTTPDIHWSIPAPEPNELPGKNPLWSCWTGNPGGSTVCFSFKNPRTQTPLYLKIKSGCPLFHCRNIRLYNQQTGELIASINPPRSAFEFTKTPACRLPETDFTACRSEWIDMEIECDRIPTETLRHKGRKLLHKLNKHIANHPASNAWT